MKISELPEEIRKVALLRQQECKDPDYEKNTDELEEAFEWDDTEEGEDYWGELDEAEPGTKEIESTNGTKESEGKLIYELDFEFIKAMAERMAKNKSKYEPFNWQKPIAVDEIKKSFFRHSMEVMQGNYKDEGDEFGHILATSINAMILYYQLKNNQQ